MRAPYYGLPYLVAASLSLPLSGCGSSPAPNQTMLADTTKVVTDTPQPVAAEPEEGIDTESTIFTWLGVAKRPSQLRTGPRVGAEVSPSVWLAAHDTLKFVQIASEDPTSGLIITDWYTPPNRSDERLRVSVLITSYALRSDSFKVSVEREVRGRDGQWTPSTVDSKTVADLDNAILLRARQIHAETYRNTVLAQ
jgi:uncharacterized lipoprotein